VCLGHANTYWTLMNGIHYDEDARLRGERQLVPLKITHSASKNVEYAGASNDTEAPEVIEDRMGRRNESVMDYWRMLIKEARQTRKKAAFFCCRATAASSSSYLPPTAGRSDCRGMDGHSLLPQVTLTPPHANDRCRKRCHTHRCTSISQSLNLSQAGVETPDA
jgi:hypothetical protein